ncbi:MAG TPA: Hsp33 family molecular chaperone HslO [Lachnospiraceae bacterium]|nr:Hsp33 family molecular chaperone HslO [Lachnospiraceae bacterium]
MSDYIVRATAANSQIRAFACSTKEMVEKARIAHNTSPVITAALGRLLTAGAMMGSMLKGEKEILTLQVNCSGPIKGLTVTADSSANVKGYALEPQVMLPPNEKGKLDVGGAMGLGVLSVIKDLGLKTPYVGQTVLQTGEIAEDLTYYFATSEQVPSSVGLGVLMDRDNTVDQAGGFIIQLMPFAEEAVISGLEASLAKISSVTTLLSDGNTPEQILEIILGDLGLEILDTTPTQFHCNCNKKHIEKAIVCIGKKDIQEMIDDGESIEINCHFCNTNYHFTVEDLEKIIKRSK